MHHIVRVLRIKTGEEVAVFDDKGNEYVALVKESASNQVTLEIKNKLMPKKQNIRITIACAILKDSRMDDIVDKLTQLGVDRIIPLKTARVIVKLDKLKEAARLTRWRKISQSASKQSQRNGFPAIDPVKDFKELTSESREFDLNPTLTLPA